MRGSASTLVRWLSVAVIVLIAGCAERTVDVAGVSAEGAEAVSETVLESRASVPDEEGLLPSPALPESQLAALAAACPAPSTCSSTYGSCAAWSTYTSCGTPVCAPESCCLGKYCDIEGNETARQKYAYRVCFSSSGASCTEYRIQTTYSCSITPCP